MRILIHVIKMYYYNKCIEFNADGVDFVSFNDFIVKKWNPILSLTKDELKTSQAIPKTPYVFWRMVDGKKEYLNAICRSFL